MVSMKSTAPVVVVLLALVASACAGPTKTEESLDGKPASSSDSSDSSGSNDGKVAADALDGTKDAPDTGPKCSATQPRDISFNVPVDAGTILSFLEQTGCKLSCKGGKPGKTGKGGNIDSEEAEEEATGTSSRSGEKGEESSSSSSESSTEERKE